jgi:type I restriction enzyme S subunit
MSDKLLSEIAHIYNGTGYKNNPPGDNFPIYGTGGLMGYTSIPLYEGPAVLSGRKGSINNPIYVDGKFWNVDTIFCIKPNEGVNAKWLYYNFLNTDLLKLNEATGVPSVSSKALYKLKFEWFEFPEQRQIAHILSTADAVIEKTQAAIAKYKAIKQGMLHDLFTRGIDFATGKLRPSYTEAPELYKESKLGWIPEEWEVEFLGNLISVSSGEGLTQTKIKPGAHPVYGGNGINGYHADYLFKEEKLIIGRVGEYCGNAFITQPFSWVTDNALVVTSFEKEFNTDYWVTYLNFLDLNSIAFAAAQPVITGGIISKVSIIKTSRNEQDSISDRIITANQKLQTEQNYLNKLKQIKMGLMNDLLSGKKPVQAQYFAPQ